MRVRRVSDNREEDIGFVQTDLDSETLLTFAAGFDCFVSVWYDQSGQGRHATQTEPTLQPQIVRDGKITMDTNSNQISMRFNGAYLVTDWEPTAAQVAEGAGILASACIGLDQRSLQSGAAALTSTIPGGLTVTTEYPSPLLPDGHDVYLLEGLQVSPDESNVEVVFSSGGKLTHLKVDDEKTTFTSVTKSEESTPSGPAVLTVDTLDTTVQVPVGGSQWRRGIKLGGRIFAIPSSSDKVLEIKYAADVTGPRIIAHNLPPEIIASPSSNQSNKFWMGVAMDANVGYCIPADAEYVLQIDATGPVPVLTALGSGPTGSNSLGLLKNKWHDAVVLNGKVWAVPHNAGQMLTIDPATYPPVSLITTGPTLPPNSALFSAAVASGDKVVGVPWSAACFLVANTLDSTVSLQGTTGLTPFLANNNAQGSAYIDPPTLTVADPGNGGVPLQVSATLGKTRSVVDVTVTNQGSGYTSSPRVTWNIGGGIRVSSLPQSPKPGGQFTQSGTVIAPTMELVNPANPQLGYKITKIRLTSGGSNLPLSDSQKPTVTISEGKGSPAKAQAVVAEGKVILINVDPRAPGSGYTEIPSIVLVGGGGSGATAQIDGITPIVYTTNPTTGEITSTGGALTSITVKNVGSGYKSAPEVRIGSTNTGKGITATAIPEMAIDGQVARVTVTNAGEGYVQESANPGDPLVVIDPPQRPGGIRARANISAINETGGITKITVINVGSGYTSAPNVTVRSSPNAPLVPPATATCEFAEDGWVTGLTITQQGTKYLTRPGVTVANGFGPRKDDGSTSSAPSGVGAVATVTVHLEGTTTIAPSPYVNNGVDGTRKFLATFVPAATPEKPSPPVYCFPYHTNRILKFVTAGDAFTCTDEYPKASNGANDIFALGRGVAQHVAGVAVNYGTSETFYAIPYGRKQILKYTESDGAQILPKIYNGAWNMGIFAPNNKNIYCVPADTKALLVIDTKQESKSEMVAFANVNGNQRNKWWGAVLAGDTPDENLIFGIPGDIGVVLELNPGVPLRRKVLPATGVVLPDKRHILFAPSLQQDGTTRALVRYDTQTKEIANVITAPPTANVTYAEGVVIPGDGNVIFVPTYNQTDPFAYTGQIGIFNIATDKFSYSSTRVPIESAAPFPSRTAAALGGGKLVSWVPRETTDAMMTYDHASGALDARGTRTETKVDVAAAVLVGDPGSSQSVLVAQPSVTKAVIASAPTYDYEVPQFAGAALTRQNVVVLVPGATDHVTLFYPDAPGNTLDVLPGTPALPVTRMTPPPDILDEFASLAYTEPKFSGAIYNNVDQKVYCVPLHYWRVMVIDPVNYSISDFGDVSQDAGTVAEPGGKALYWGGCQGGDGKLYFTPYDAHRILVVDPTVENPSSRISYIDLPATLPAGSERTKPRKWRGGALTNDGRIFCAPYDASTVLIIDPDTKTSAVVGGFEWLGTGAPTDAGKFCDAVVGSNKLVYLMPARSPYIIRIDPAETTAETLGGVLELDTKVGDHASSDRWGGACAAPNGRIYTAPYAYPEILEYDTATGLLDRLGGSSEYFASSNRDGARWRAIIPGRDGNVYAFPSWWTKVLRIETEKTRAYIWNRQGSPAWLATRPMDGPYRLRPFLLSDTETAVFHTSGRSSLVMYNTKDATANTAPIVGPGVQEGIAAHFPEAADRILVGNNTSVVTVTPFQGAIAGVKSYSGTADMFIGTSGPDLTIEVGTGSVGIRNVLNTLLKDGAPGVYAAYGSATTGDLNLFLRDVPLGGNTYSWSGEVGNTFAVGIVQGTEAQAFGAPSYRRGFNGLISELVAFQSNRTAQGRALGESASFYYLDSKSTIS
jgi:hypothetical protein